MTKCGIIGCGVIAPTHIEAYRALPETEVVHLCDLVPEKAEKLAAKYAVRKSSTDYRRLLDDPEVELVSVCTDHASHAKIVSDALAAGKHVVCEKPLGRTQDDLTAMIAAADAHPELVASGIFQHRFDARNRAFRELVRNGALGRIITINFCGCCERTAAYYQADAWRGTVSGEGGGVLINQMIHFIDQLRFVFGEVNAVSGLTANVTHQGVIEVEDTASFTLEFDGGMFGGVTATSSSLAKWRSDLTVVAEKANLQYLNERACEIVADDALAATIREKLGTESAAPVVGKSYYGGGHTGQLGDVVAAIREKRAPQVTLREAAGTAALIFAVYESAAAGGRRVEVRRF